MTQKAGRKFAISDIHGCVNTFETLLDKIEFSHDDELFLLGDYLDRGPDSQGVIDAIWQLEEEGHKVKCLRGNHEQMLLNDIENGSMWGYGSDPAMLKSFGAKDVRGIPEAYVDWIEKLPYFAEADEYLLVHAGLDFVFGDPFANTYDMMWLRNWYEKLDREWLGDRIIVHGHTPTIQSAIVASLYNLDNLPVVNIDNGCFYRSTGKGELCAFEMTNKELFFQENEDRSETNLLWE
jgi:serine/threonine protein phosphatase 1